MHNRVRLKICQKTTQEFVIEQVTFAEVDLFAVAFLECLKPFLNRVDRDRAVASYFFDPLTAQKPICTSNFVTPHRQILRKSPAQIAIDSSDKNLHLISSETAFSTEYNTDDVLSSLSGRLRRSAVESQECSPVPP